MNRVLAIVLGVVAILTIVVGASALFTVHQTQQALVLQFGEPKRVIKDPGLQVKMPFIQDVQYYEKRTLPLDPPRQQVILIDQKRMDVDTFGRFKIEDPLRFFQTVGNETGARSRLSAIINAALRRVLGSVSLPEILSADRQGLIDQIRSEVNVEANRLGIEIVEVRIRRADYPVETSQAIFNRMRSERERKRPNLAEGEELPSRSGPMRIVSRRLLSPLQSGRRRNCVVRAMDRRLKSTPSPLVRTRSSLRSTGPWKPIAKRLAGPRPSWSYSDSDFDFQLVGRPFQLDAGDAASQ